MLAHFFDCLCSCICCDITLSKPNTLVINRRWFVISYAFLYKKIHMLSGLNICLGKEDSNIMCIHAALQHKHTHFACFDTQKFIYEGSYDILKIENFDTVPVRIRAV